VPDSLRRADGESIYRAHGSELYATRAQLSMEEQLVADAQAKAAPRFARELAARLLGADLAQLDAQVRAAGLAPDGLTQGGLRRDQGTTAFVPLTSPRRAEPIVGPAGTLVFTPDGMLLAVTSSLTPPPSSTGGRARGPCSSSMPAAAR
jgi:hypothetical protein